MKKSFLESLKAYFGKKKENCIGLLLMYNKLPQNSVAKTMINS